MTDRLQMVTDLGVLAGEAAQRGDDRAADILRGVAGHLMEVHGELLKGEDRRRRDRERKPKIPRKSTESAENAESSEKGGFPPDPLSSKRTTETQQHGARAREAAAIQDVNSEMVNRYTAILTKQLNGEWPDVDAFLKRRPYSTWESWLREMVTLVRGGSQFVPADLAQVCRDDGALDRPIGSPKGLRIFIGSARQERLNPSQNTAPRQRTTAAQRTGINGAEALKDIA